MSRQLTSVSEKLEGAFEGLICIASAAFVLAGTLAICFPVLAPVAA